MAMMDMELMAPVALPFIVVAADGSGDYTTIQAACSALSATGGFIYVKRGIYTVTGAFDDIRPGNNTWIFGEGKGVQIDNSYGGGRAILIYGKSYVKVTNIFFNQTASSRAVYIASSNDCEVSNCWSTTTGVSRPAFHLDSSNRCRILNNTVNVNIDTAILLTHVFGDCSDNIIANNIIIGVGNNVPAIAFGFGFTDVGNNNIVSHNRVTNYASDGIKIESSFDRTIVTGNNFNGCTNDINDSGVDTEIGHNVA